MASIIRIKRSGSTAAPQNGLAAGELAYSWNSDKLYVGTGTETNGIAANMPVIGGLYYTSLVDASTAGQLTTTESSIPVLGADGSIDQWLVGNLELTGNTISSTDTNGNINITPNGTGSIVLDGQNWPQADGLTNYFLKTDGAGQLSWTAIPSGSFTISGDTGTDSFTTGETLTFTGGSGINTSITNNTVTISLDTESAQDIIGDMVSSNTEDGISVTYDDASGKLNFDVSDFTITLGGDLTGSATVTNLGNVTLNATVAANSVELGTDTTGNYVATVADAGNGNITVANSGTETAAVTLDLTATGVTAATYGSATAIPSFTVDAYGRITSATTNSISSSFTLSDGSNTDTFNNGETLTFTGDGPVNTLVTNNEVTISVDDATTSTKGIASFDTNNFTVTAGAVSTKDITIGTTSLTNGETTVSLAGLQQLDVDNLRFDGNEISSTDTNGTISINPNGTGHISVNNKYIQNVPDPINDTDAANKRYVDAVAEGLHVHEQAHAIATSSLATITGGTVTYSNGTNGVGATLTLGTALNLAGGDIDGDTDITTGDRIIIAGESNAAHNGVYVVTSTTVLTRADDFDTPTEMAGGDFIFVTHGNTYADTGWVLGEAVTTVGTSNVTFVQFSGAGAIGAGLGLVQNGTTIDINLANNSGLTISSDELQVASTIAGDGLTFSNGVVNVVSADANRITVAADNIDIASTYVGQTSITTLGTITTGTWNGTSISNAYVDNDLTIVGGTIDNTPIGATTASTGAFTTLSSSGLATLSSLSVTNNAQVNGNLSGAGTTGTITSELDRFIIDGGTF